MAAAREAIRLLARCPSMGRPPIATRAVFVIALIAIGSALLLLPFDAAISRMRLDEPAGVLAFLGYATDVGLIRWYLYPSLVVLVALLVVEWEEASRGARMLGLRIFIFAAHLLLAVSTAQLLVQALKRLFGRARPPLLDEHGSLSFGVGRGGDEFYSFPSGHSSTVAVVTVALMIWFPQIRLPILIAGVAFALTRIVVGAHYPSDVIVGFGIGFLTAVLLARWFAGRGLGFRFAHGGRGFRGLLPVRR